jgi:hypothetical protein
VLSNHQPFQLPEELSAHPLEVLTVHPLEQPDPDLQRLGAAQGRGSAGGCAYTEGLRTQMKGRLR